MWMFNDMLTKQAVGMFEHGLIDICDASITFQEKAEFCKVQPDVDHVKVRWIPTNYKFAITIINMWQEIMIAGSIFTGGEVAQSAELTVKRTVSETIQLMHSRRHARYCCSNGPLLLHYSSPVAPFLKGQEYPPWWRAFCYSILRTGNSRDFAIVRFKYKKAHKAVERLEECSSRVCVGGEPERKDVADHLKLEIIGVGKKKLHEAKSVGETKVELQELQEFKHAGDDALTLTPSYLYCK
ncbi:Uncharacterized protein Rs2_01071 [Raphanus sativus]|nr:Uncharacterized protein Rs2_01071 [Raphanus sativus]